MKDTPSSRTRTRKAIFSSAKLFPEKESFATLEGDSKEAMAKLAGESQRAGGPVTIMELGLKCCKWPVWALRTSRKAVVSTAAPRWLTGRLTARRIGAFPYVPTPQLRLGGLGRMS